MIIVPSPSYRLMISAIVSSAALSINTTALAQCDPFENVKIPAPGGDPEDHFATQVALSGDRAAIAARLDDDAEDNAGAVYIFRRKGDAWEQEAKLFAPDAQAGELFGMRVVLDGDTLIGGTSSSQHGAHVFRLTRGQWLHEATLAPSEPADSFGWGAAISGDVAVVGATLDSEVAPVSGSAFVFRRTGSTWVEEAKLFASDGAPFDRFGAKVAIEEDIIVFGVGNSDGGASNTGAVYIFRDIDGRWVEDVKLTASEPELGDRFGASVDLMDDLLVVGATTGLYVLRFDGAQWIEEAHLTAPDMPEDSHEVSIASPDLIVVGSAAGNDERGAAYTFRNVGGTWISERTLSGSDSYTTDAFGSAVAASGGIVVVGAHENDENGENAGSVYMFDLDNPVCEPPLGPCHDAEVATLLPDFGTDGWFGGAVAISGGLAAAGAKFDSDAGTNAGAVYVFRRDGDRWIEDAKLTASDAEPNDNFGISVAISENTLVVGTQGAATAYVFRRDAPGWTEIAKLHGVNHSFGDSLAIEGDTIMVGEPGSGDGTVQVFRSVEGNWVFADELTPSFGFTEDFGSSVDISGDAAIIGAKDSEDAYIFRRHGDDLWLEEARLLPWDETGFNEQFGWSVAIDDDVAVVGAHNLVANPTPGKAYVFRNIGGTHWLGEDILTARIEVFDENYGFSLATDGHRILVGAPSGSYGSDPEPAVYLYRWGGDQWEEEKITSLHAGSGDHFAYSVSVSENTAVVGARLFGAQSHGAAFIYDLTCASCPIDISGDGVVNAADLAVMFGDWFSCTRDCPGDVNDDGVVDQFDLAIILGHWGPCP